jgi:hypothetical protein
VIPDSIHPVIWALPEDCWTSNPDDRLTFDEIVDRLSDMDFKVMLNVNSIKIKRFVQKINDWEAHLLDN